ncbi:MAG TPA: O-antigen ligase family protein, partial [Puia sp.]|nr:O-antigen ligase family protein [Puia sp.]
MSQHITRRRNSWFTSGLRYHFLEKKLNTFLGFFLLALITVSVTYAITLIDFKIGPIVVGVVFALGLLVAFFKYPYFGFYFLIILSAVAALLERMIKWPVPVGTFVEMLTYLELIIIQMNYELRRSMNGRFWRNPISIGFYILLAFFVIELFNPAMFSKLGWFSFFRKQISTFVFFYLCYCFLNTKKRIFFFVDFMIGFTTLLALYACKQQWFGYANFELRAIGAGMVLLFQGGLVRKLSVFGDPATSGILFASISMLSIVLLLRENSNKRRFWLSVAALINLLGYSYSGTRTATLMIVAGIAFYSIATIYEKRSLVFLLCSIITFMVFMVMPYQNVVTGRIKSTFEGTKDLSAAIRDYNRHRVQPYIHEHPIGGGIYTCGFEGPKYNHGHYLELLQPDSGYMKVIAEQGPLGLLMLLLFYLIAMRQGIRNFYRARQTEIQNYYIALLVMMFTMIVAQYSQMALIQYPIIFYFHATMIIFIKLTDY